MFFDETRLKAALDEYKNDFPTRWKKEKYKWEAVETFQKHWNIDTDDAKFAKMLSDSLAKTGNLLAYRGNLAKSVIIDLANNAPAEVHDMFKELFNEDGDMNVIDRIQNFKAKADELYKQHGDPETSHHQKENAITTYLWLRYPEKYYIYKISVANALATELGLDYHFKQGDYINNLMNFYPFYNAICTYIHMHTDIPNLLEQYNHTGYPDKELKTLTSDFGFYIKQKNGDSGDDDDIKYWWLNSNPKIWRISSLEVGKTQTYTLYNENGNPRHIFKNFVEAKVGDKVIGYESSPTRQIVSLCEVSAKHEDKDIEFIKLENFDVPIDRADIEHIPELSGMEYINNPNGSLFKLTKDEYDCLIDIIREANPLKPRKKYKKYDKKRFLEDVFMDDESSYDRLKGLLESKKNIILKGVPGVGKTWAATRLAYSMMGKEDDSRIESIQFHQNYSYEDFMMGYKPVEDTSGEANGVSFALKNGSFYRFCLKARNHPKDDYFFIIDEINRGNMSKIFGELLMLIEKDYRGDKKKVTLPYKDEQFSVPENIYIIGMMNTADRSLAMIDYALRRRFGHFELKPAFNTTSFKNYMKSLNNATFNNLIDAIIKLNRDITKDANLGEGFCIGHSYFCNWKPANEETMHKKMLEVVDYEILPMLEEYWFDDNKNVDKWRKILHGVLGVSDVTEGA